MKRTVKLNPMKFFLFQDKEKGMSLVAVLWIVTILTVLASEMIYSLHLEIKSSRNWNDQVKAYYAAKGGFETAIANFKADETSYDSLDEEWAQGITGELNDSTYETEIIDESSLINVNTIDEETLARVIEYCLTNQQSDKDLSETEISAKAQELASAIVAERPFRTTAEMARAEGMTPEILYSYTGESKYLWIFNKKKETTQQTSTDTEQQETIALVDITTVYSADKNVASDGSQRVNINSADANAIVQNINPQNQQVITQQEAQAIVDYRSQANQNQQQQQGGQPAQQGQPQQGGNQEAYKGISSLLDVPAISQETLNAIRNRITVDDQGGNQQGDQQGQQQLVNINSADANQLASLSDRIDNGIAESIVAYRQNNRFNNVDDLLQVRAVSIQDLRTIADRITTTDDDVVAGKININTISSELLRILPGMDEQKAEAIIAHRGSGTSLANGKQSVSSSNQQGGPLEDIGQLMDVQGIDEQTFRQLIDIITYRSYTFRIKSTGKSADEKIISDFMAIIDRSGNNIKTKYWKQL